MIRGNQPTDITIRPATVRDYAAIVEVWRASGSHFDLQGRESEVAYRRQLRQFPESYLVAADGNRVVGVVLGSHDARKGWINRLAVLPEFRRRGIAAALVIGCDAALRAKGLDIVCALVESHNTASAQLFTHLGYGKDVPVLYFRKVTPPGR